MRLSYGLRAGTLLLALAYIAALAGCHRAVAADEVNHGIGEKQRAIIAKHKQQQGQE